MYPKIYIDLFRTFDRNQQVFVGMPFSNKFEFRWDKIFEPAIKSCKLTPYRTKDLLVSDSIPIDILEGIGKAKYLLFDISDEKKEVPNPNVMHELGIAHSTRLPEEVIILRDEQSNSTPFDIKYIRWNSFSTSNIEESKNKIEKLIKNAEIQIDLTKDIIIKNTLSRLDFDMLLFLNILRDHGNILDGFDFYPFDLYRKGLYSLLHKDTTVEYLREIARELINLGILKSAKLISPQNKIYGGTPEYYFTELGKAIMLSLPSIDN